MFRNPLFKGLKGAVFTITLYTTSLVGTVVIMGPTLLLLWLQPRWFRWVNDRLICIWLCLPPVRFVVYVCLNFVYKFYQSLAATTLLSGDYQPVFS